MNDISEKERRFLKEEFFGWRARKNLANSYLDVCKGALIDDNIFYNFKRYPAYNVILEHVSHDLGKKHLDHVKENNPPLLEYLEAFIEKNDKIGNPKKTTYNSYTKLEMSPTTARYIKVLSDLEILFGSLHNMNIVEIGGGYGGLATVIHTKYKFNNYYNIDLSLPYKLSKKYCEINQIDGFDAIPPHRVENFFQDKNIDLVISNYAFSECNYETQDQYIECILKKSKRGYLTHNTHKERSERTKNIMKNYKDVCVYGTDLSHKNHPILYWKEEGES